MPLINLLIYFFVLLLVFGLAWWVLTQIPLPAPIAQMARVVIVVIFALILIFMLLGVIGVGPNIQIR